MSQMLQTAVIEAAALRDAAMRNAEALLVEKFAGRVKTAIDEILEADEEDPLADAGAEDLGLGSDMGASEDPSASDPAADMGAGDLGADMGTDEPGATSSISEDVPLAPADGKKLCSCPDEEEEIEIDFGELERQMADDTTMEAGEMVDREEIAPSADTSLPDEEEPLMESENGDEDDELDEGAFAALMEELQVEVEPVSSGYLGTNATERKEAGEISLARLKDEEVQEEIEELKSAVSDLTEQKSRADQKINKVLAQNKNLRNLILKAEQLIKETNMANAKLMYTNRILKDTSLNERQKKEFAEVILKADSVEGAKVMYETLQRSAGAGGIKIPVGPKSLTEASNRSPSRSGSFIKERIEKQEDPEIERMKSLAGIKTQKLQRGETK